jgi:predicted Zn-dependent protease
MMFIATALIGEALASTTAETTLVKAQVEQAIVLANSGHLLQAEHVLRSVLQHDPHHFDALQIVGSLLLYQNHTTEAERYLKAAFLQTEFSVAFVANNYIECLMQLNRAQEAKQARAAHYIRSQLTSTQLVIRALEKQGRVVPLLKTFAALLKRTGEYSAAADVYIEIVNAEASDLTAWSEAVVRALELVRHLR